MPKNNLSATIRTILFVFYLIITCFTSACFNLSNSSSSSAVDSASSSSQATGAGGGAMQSDPEAIGGGDLLMARLNSARWNFFQSLLDITAAKDLIKLCDATYNESTHPLMAVLRKLNAAQKKECQNFILAHVGKMLSLNQTQPITEFRISQEPLFVTTPSGNVRVSARTAIGLFGEITFDYEIVRLFSYEELNAQIGHEFCHKVDTLKRSDDDSTSHFPTVRELFDTVGVAIAMYGLRSRGAQDLNSDLKLFATCKLDSERSNLSYAMVSSQLNVPTAHEFDLACQRATEKCRIYLDNPNSGDCDAPSVSILEDRAPYVSKGFLLAGCQLKDVNDIMYGHEVIAVGQEPTSYEFDDSCALARHKCQRNGTGPCRVVNTYSERVYPTR